MLGCRMSGKASYTRYLINSVKETESGGHRSLTMPISGRTVVLPQACVRATSVLFLPHDVCAVCHFPSTPISATA